ncbi:MAG TPA: tetratricopeptide repeat protein [Gemmatimonadales bacterium]|nr:tetratricopeptide repeat protein [Gemmatimonadales bacterium]
MSKLEKLKERARLLEAKDTRAAIDAWLSVLHAQDEEGDPNPDLGIFNRIGDLYLKARDPGQAADYYDRAVDRYAELGFHNNAIAMCNKVLRNAPGRPTTYLKLAKLYAAKGFTGEAKQNFIEYAERMQKAGAIQQAFQALKEFVDISSEGEQLREMLEEHLRAYGGPELQAKFRTSAPRLSTSGAPPVQKPKRKTSSLVFLDLDEPAKAKAPPGRPSVAPLRPTPPAVAPPSVAARATPPPGAIETTSLVEEAPTAEAEPMEGLEPTGEDFGNVREAVSDIVSIRDAEVPKDAPPLMGLEPTSEPEVGPPEPVDVLGGLPLVSAFDAPDEAEAAPVAEAEVVPEEPPAAPPKRKTVVEIPPLELEPDFDSVELETSITEREHDVDNEPLAEEDGGWVQTETTLGSGTTPSLDLGLDVVKEGEGADALVFDGLAEAAPSALTIEELESRVADDPDDAEAHQALGEALIETGERERGIEELDIATAGFESLGNLAHAQGLVGEILRLDPNSVRHRQKQVEFAYKSGDKTQLIEAYIELADTLLRGDLADKARAVYERVAEHDPKNERARAALAMLAPAAPPQPEGRVAAKDAKMRVRDETGGAAGDFVDLGAMILDESAPRDSRMKVEDEEPTGDEEQDFREMLARFRQGIDENIEETDFQSHYDLGVAFKEMGLLDEAIAEFQKALRAPEGKLRTSEALGVCFHDKGAFGVAESILRRALELPSTGDQERLGILYWLARALEEQGKPADARDLYGRVFAVDIRFMDVGARVKALARAH